MEAVTTLEIELSGGSHDGLTAHVPLAAGFLPDTVTMAWSTDGVPHSTHYVIATREPLKSADGERRLYRVALVSS